MSYAVSVYEVFKCCLMVLQFVYFALKYVYDALTVIF